MPDVLYFRSFGWRRALQKMAPYTVSQDAGVEGAVVLDKGLEQKSLLSGYVAAKGEYEHMVNSGIIDPVKVMRASPGDAASVSSLLTTPEVDITELPKDDAPGFRRGGVGGSSWTGKGYCSLNDLVDPLSPSHDIHNYSGILLEDHGSLEQWPLLSTETEPYHFCELSVRRLEAEQGRKPRAPRYNYKITREALRVDGWSTPAWVKVRLELITQSRSQSRASYGTKDWSQDIPQGSRSNQMDSVGSTSEAVAVLKNRLQRGIKAGSYKYVELLQMCLKKKDLIAAKQVHDCIIQSGMDKNLYVANTLLNVYIRCGEFSDARRVFDQLEKKSLITWNKMIAGYARSHHAESAVEVFKLMRHEGARPNEVTYLCILKACASPSALQWGKEVHECIQRAGLESDVRVGTALLQMYSKCGCITEARQVFDKLTNRDFITWTVMIGAYAESGRGVEAYNLFLEMRRAGFEPNAITYVSILNAAASAGAFEWVKEVHGHASKAGLESDLRVGAALVHMYAKSGSIDYARRVFDSMEKRDVVTWNIMLGGFAQHGCGHEALELFRRMNSDLVKPDRTTFAAVLSACCHAGLLDEGRRLFLAMTPHYDIEPDIGHYTCMVDLLGRAGHLEEAKLFISNMPVQPGEVTWRALLGACRTYGNVECGELAAKELFKLDPNNPSAYVLLSNVYAAAGKWEKVSLVRAVMQKRGVHKEPGRTWIEVDDKIHEFFVGDTSHPEAKAIYTYISNLTEKLKAEGYIPATQIVLQNIDDGDKELALCSHSEKLAIAYGLMHTPGGKPIRVYKNLRVCSDCHTATKFISKVTGREIIARDAIRYHHFKDGVCSCGDYW